MATALARNGAKRRIVAWRVVFYLILVAISLITVVPFLFMLSTSFTKSFSMMSYPPRLLPPHPNLRNYRELIFEFQDGLFPRWFFNSVLITTAIIVGSLFLNTLAGYLFAKKRFVGRNLVFALMLSTLMVPTAVKLIPAFQVARMLHLYGTYWGVIVPSLASPIGIFMMRQFISGLPSELIEAAKIDGASEMRIFLQIVVPLSKPAMAALGIFTGVTAWNDFLWPLVMLPKAAMRTLPVGLATIQGQFTVDFGMVMAGSVMAILPMVVLFLLFQRQFVAGLRTGYGR
jgi:multiple sugar transport system permease protein